MTWVVPPPSNSGNEGFGWDSLLKMVHNPGGDSYWEGGQPKITFLAVGQFPRNIWF